MFKSLDWDVILEPKVPGLSQVRDPGQKLDNVLRK